MLKRTFSFFLLLSILVTLRSYNLVYLQESYNSLELEINLNDLQISNVEGFTQLQLSQADSSPILDSPNLPVIRLFFAVPKNGDIQVQTSAPTPRTINLELPLSPVPRRNPEDSFTEVYHIDQYMYSLTGAVDLIKKLPKEKFSQYDVIPIEITPISYNHNQRQITYSENIRLYVTITGDFPQNVSEYVSRHPHIYESVFVNSKYGLNFKQERNVDFNTSEFYRSHSWYRIEVSSTGMHVLDYQFLSSLPLRDIDPREIRIFSTGGMMLSPNINKYGFEFKEIPLHIDTKEPNSFTENDKIFFYAEERDGFGKLLPHGRFQMNYNYGTTGRPGYMIDIGDFMYTNPHSKAGVYWLTWGGNFDEPPKRMSTQNLQNHSRERSSGRVNTLHYIPRIRREDYGYLWYTQQIETRVSTPTHARISVEINDLDSNFPQKFNLVGSTLARADSINTTGMIRILEPHRLTVTANNSFQLVNKVWRPIGMYREISAGNFLIENNNEFLFTAYGDNIPQYIMYFDLEWFRHLIKRNVPFSFRINPDDTHSDILYKYQNETGQSLRVYQVDSFHEAKIIPNNNNSFIANANSNAQFIILAENEYLKPSSIQLVQTVPLDINTLPHEVTIIYAEEFFDGAVRLRDIYRTHYGYESHIVKLEDLFDNFNGGHPDPTAVRNYLHYLQNILPNEPMGAIFLGSGTTDYRNITGSASSKNKFMVNTLDYNEPARAYNFVHTSDDSYAMIESHDTPEILVGRIPAQTTQELNSYLNKLDEYLRNPYPGWWQFTALLIADDEIYSDRKDDFNHSDQLETLSRRIENSAIIDKIHATEYEIDPSKTKPQVRNMIVDKLNEGRLYWLFIGHGSIRNNGDERYFNADSDIRRLRNRGKYPIYIAASCDCGAYDVPGITSIAEDLVLVENAGSIISICATGKSGSASNSHLFTTYFDLAIHENQSPGITLNNSKRAHRSAHRYSNIFYNILGDPFLRVSFPTVSNNFAFTTQTDSLMIWQTVHGKGSFDASVDASTVQSLVYDSGRSYLLRTVDGVLYIFNKDTVNERHVTVNRNNLPIFRGRSTLNNNEYNLGFIIPDDIGIGKRGRIFTMASDTNNRSYVNVTTDIHFSGEKMQNINTKPPEISIYMENENFTEGDTISPDPVFYAKFKSEYGLNTVGANGRNMWVAFDKTFELYDVTSGFEYDLDSYTEGSLKWQFHDLDAGRHDLSFSVYDSFNSISARKTWFIAANTADISISNLLVAPNPIKQEGYFTFDLSDEAEITIRIYTISGRRIKTIHKDVIDKFAVIEWDGRDSDGDRLANGTYFYTVRATLKNGRGSVEKTDKLMILR